MAPKAKASTRTDAAKVPCLYCNKEFASRGLTSHERSCHLKPSETDAADKAFEDCVRQQGLLRRFSRFSLEAFH